MSSWLLSVWLSISAAIMVGVESYGWAAFFGLNIVVIVGEELCNAIREGKAQ